MKTSIWTRLIVTALTVCAAGALAAPTWASGDDITLRRDGSKAVPFVPDLRPGLGKQPHAPSTVAAEGFDWGDAAIGAGLGAVAALLAVAGSGVVRGRRPLGTTSPRSGPASS